MKFKPYYSNKNSEMTKRCRKQRNRFKREKFVVLVQYLEQQTDCHRCKWKNRKWRRVPSWMSQSNLFTFPYQTNGNHATELSAVGHIISEWHWKSTFNFTEIVNNYWLKRGIVISLFSLKLYTQYWSIFIAWS